MADPIRCHACGSSHDRSDPFCPKCGAASSEAQAMQSGEVPAPKSAATDAALLELQGALAPQIQVIKQLGAGGMGTVFLGRDPALKRLVAIKVLNPEFAHDESARKRFEREAEAAAAVAHPHVVSIYQVGVLPASQSAYFVMQFIEGHTLEEEFPPGTPAPVPLARRIIGEVASALAAAHAKGLVHRDIKPANIMIDRDTGRTVVLDFGISAVLQARRQHAEPKLTATGSSIGTPTYMSPEQASAEDATEKSDVYSLGTVAFELLTGRPPFVEASSWALMAAHIKVAPPRVRELAPNVDPEFADLIDKCLGKNPVDRPAAADITRYLLPGAQAILEWPPPGLEQLRGSGSRLVAALAVAVGFAWLFLGTILLQPSRMWGCCWNLPGAGSLWDSLVSTVGAILPVLLEEKDIQPFWAIAIAGSLVALPLFQVFVWRRAWRLADHVRSARRSGYPWRVVVEVAWDRRTDTVSLINGVDSFALLPEQARRRLLRLRWWEEAMLGAAVLAAMVMPLVWIVGLLPHGAPSSGAALPASEMLWIVVPLLACLSAAALCARPEIRFRRRARHGRQPAVARGLARVRPELVDTWLRAAGAPAPRTHRAWPRPVVAILAVFAITVPAVAVILAVSITVVASGRVTSMREDLAHWSADSARTAWRRLGQAMARSTGPAAGDARTREAAAQVPVAFLPASQRAEPVWAADSALWDRYPPEREPEALRKRLDKAITRSWRALPGRLPDSLAIALARDTGAPTLGLWRAFAVSPPPPPLWYFRAGLLGVQSPQSLPWVPWPAIDLAARRNVAVAILALSHGDKVGALARARENLPAGWRMYRDPGPSARGVGGLVFVRAIVDLGVLGRATGDTALSAEASRLRAAFSLHDSTGYRLWQYAGLLFSDPSSPAGLVVVGDSALAPGARFDLVSYALWGFCTSVREILFGVDPRRRQVLADAAARLADIPRSADWVAFNRRYLDRWIAEPWSAWQAFGRPLPVGLLAIPASIGLRGVTARLSACMYGSW
jgi:hypothetical protein